MTRAALLLGTCLLLASSTASAAKKYYFEVRGVQVPAGSPATLKERARAAFVAELKKQETVVLEEGTPSLKGAEMEKALKEKKLQGYALVLRVVKAKHSLQPPAPGKAYKQLFVEVDVAIDAEKIPSGQMALAGEGNAQVGTEVQAVKEKEKQQLLGEALAEAIKQAVAKSMSKIGTVGKAAKTPRRKKK